MSNKKPTEPCRVCGKKTDDECSHIECPNRKRETAMPPPGRWHSDGSVPVRRSDYDHG